MDVAFKEELFKIVANNIDFGIAIVDRKGYFTYYNQIMGDIEGLDEHEVLGKHLFNVYPSFNEKNSTLFDCLATGTPVYNELQTYINGKGRKIFSIVTNIPIKVNNEIVGAVEIAKDVDRNEKTLRSVESWLNKSKAQDTNTEKIKSNYYNLDDFITTDKVIIKLIEKIKRMARHDSNVLIFGETGTGKEIIAQSIHNISSRRNKIFIAQNCAAIPENLLESILFGTEKGSFTGAIDKEGLFEQADGGTLLLDELNSLPFFLQAKLLRVLQEKYIRRVGGSVDKKIDVRIIATVNEDPIKLIQIGKLREDLFYRLNIAYLYIPPLRDRKDDIPILVQHFIKHYSKMFNKRPIKLSKSINGFFESYEWKGNVRELKNIIEYIMMTLEEDDEISLSNLPYYLLERPKKDNTNVESTELDSNNNAYHDMLNDFESKIILEGLTRCRWNVSKTADMLNIKRQTLQRKIKTLNLER